MKVIFGVPFKKNGKQKDYQYVFAGKTWNADTFKPKYNMKPIMSQYMFYYFGYEENSPIDLVDLLNKQGVILNVGSSSNVTSMFRYSNFNHVPAIDTRSASSLQYLFADSNIETIDELILKDNGTQTFDSTFYLCSKLKNITISGVFANNIGLTYCSALSKTSVTSIISALSNTATGKLIKFNKGRIYTLFSDDGVNLNDEWWTLVNSKSNWDIQLA